jgi:hypothetical protein
MLLLDETFAPLDPASKRLVQAQIRAACRNSIVLVIYHRDSEYGGESSGGKRAEELRVNTSGGGMGEAGGPEEVVPCVPAQVMQHCRVVEGKGIQIVERCCESFTRRAATLSLHCYMHASSLSWPSRPECSLNNCTHLILRAQAFFTMGLHFCRNGSVSLVDVCSKSVP